MKKKQIFFSLLAISFFLFICWIIIQADRGQPMTLTTNIRLIPHGDKLGHFVLYGILALTRQFSPK